MKKVKSMVPGGDVKGSSLLLAGDSVPSQESVTITEPIDFFLFNVRNWTGTGHFISGMALDNHQRSLLRSRHSGRHAMLLPN